MDIGLRIKELRTKLKITQEELAKVLQVSTQAVSKWECGGLPDIELIPKIASYFKVTTDYLFDVAYTDYNGMEQKICDYISSITSERDRFYKMYELSYIMSIATSRNVDVKEYNYMEIMSKKENYVSLSNLNSGFSYISLKENLPFSFIFVNPPTGNFDDVLISKEKQIAFLKELSQRDFFDVFIYINSRKNKSFTSELLIKELKIAEHRADEIIHTLCKYNILEVIELELNDDIINTYTLRNNPMIIALFAILDNIVTNPSLYYYYINNKDGEYFSNIQKEK